MTISTALFDCLTCSSYFAITMQLIWFSNNCKLLSSLCTDKTRSKLCLQQMVTALQFLYCAFIALCGITHGLGAARTFTGDAWLIKELHASAIAVCAIVSVVTAVTGLGFFPSLVKTFSEFELNDEGKLERTESNWMEWVELFQQSIVVVRDSIDSTIVRGNAATEKYFGSSEGFVGTSLLSAVHPDDLHVVVSAFSRLRERGSAATVFEYRVKNRCGLHDEPYMWVESSARLAPRSDYRADGEGESEHKAEDFAIAADDEEARLLAPCAVNLGDAVPSRQDVLMITRNIDDRKQAEQLKKQAKEKENEAKMNYISCIAHDLKTPLQSFCFAVELLKATSLSKEQKEIVDQALVSTDLMKLTISQTMDISKALAGAKLAPRRSTVLLSSVLQKVHVVIDGYGKQVPVSYHVADDVADAVITDEEWLWQMLLNLLTNACKYTDEGGIKVVVSLSAPLKGASADTTSPSKGESAGPVLLFEVMDTGVGVSEAKIGELFSAFSAAQAGQMQGTGLGLFGIRLRTDGLGGACGARRNDLVKSGSVFWFTIPYVQDTSPVFEEEAVHEVVGIEESVQMFQAKNRLSENLIGLSAKSESFCAIRMQKLRRKFSSHDINGGVQVGSALQLRSFSSSQCLEYLRELHVEELKDTALSASTSVASFNMDADAHSSKSHFAVIDIAKESSGELGSFDSLSRDDSSGDRMGRTSTVDDWTDNARSEAGTANEKGDGMTAIVVDDVLMIRKCMQRVLRQAGFAKVICCENGKKGLEAMQQEEVDVVFSDVQMPLMSGPEMVRRFREFEAGQLTTRERTKRQTVVAVTANGNEFGGQDALVSASAFDFFIEKPISIECIQAIIETLPNTTG